MDETNAEAMKGDNSMKRKWNVYTVNVSSDYYVRHNVDGVVRLDWAEEYPDERMPSDDGHYDRSKPMVFPTWEKALEYALAQSGYNNCVTIDDACCGEVWSSILEYSRCKCCGDEKMDGTHSDDHHETPQHDWQLPERPTKE